MELLIADSGSTKSDWILVRDGKEISFRTEGMNPWQMSEGSFSEILKREVVSQTGADFSGAIFFYGAGCGTKGKQDAWKNVLITCFPKAMVEVNSDLLGAARALCGREAGIVAIMGTGSNSCMYDGKQIVSSLPSTGYIFGDEGGGVHIGKLFLGKYLSGELNSDLHQQFEKETGMNVQQILDGTYRNAHPNRFIASFASFVIGHRTSAECKEILEESFAAFTKKYLLHYDVKKYKVNVTGSVGIHCREMLEASWKKEGITPGKFMVRPAEGMRDYHLGK